MAGNEKWQFLHCDDFPPTRSLVKMVVEAESPADVTGADDFPEVRRLVESGRFFDAVLVDASLTHGNIDTFEPQTGVEVARYIRSAGMKVGLCSAQTLVGDLMKLANKIGVRVYNPADYQKIGIHYAFLDILSDSRDE